MTTSQPLLTAPWVSECQTAWDKREKRHLDYTYELMEEQIIILFRASGRRAAQPPFSPRNNMKQERCWVDSVERRAEGSELMTGSLGQDCRPLHFTSAKGIQGLFSPLFLNELWFCWKQMPFWVKSVNGGQQSNREKSCKTKLFCQFGGSC